MSVVRGALMNVSEIKSIPASGEHGFAEVVRVMDEALMTACWLPPHQLVVPALGVEHIPPLVFMYLQAGGKLEDVEGALVLWVREGPHPLLDAGPSFL